MPNHVDGIARPPQLALSVGKLTPAPHSNKRIQPEWTKKYGEGFIQSMESCNAPYVR